MAILLLKTHSVDSDGSNNAIVVGDKDNSPPIEAIHAVSSQQLTSQIIWPSRVLLPDPMDLEPGRCRRTDGKKWRCRFAVLPDQKYCDRHIHRGRNRSRKPVEIRETFSTSNSTKTSRISSPKAVPSLQSTTKVRIKNQSFKIKKRSGENVCVLQDSNARGGGTSRIDHGTLAGAESQRCRRTDGKKWRCKKNVVPEQKYCRKHMHRGAKKVENENLRGQNMKNRLSFSVGMSYRRMGDEAVKPAPSLCSRT